MIADRKRWKVHQQVSLALCRVYSETVTCGRAYCDGDLPERIANVKGRWLARIASDAADETLPPSELMAQFEREKSSLRQFDLGRLLANAGERSAIRELAPLLAAEDRHLRGNVAFVLARLGDERGFTTIAHILADRRERPEVPGITPPTSLAT